MLLRRGELNFTWGIGESIGGCNVLETRLWPEQIREINSKRFSSAMPALLTSNTKPMASSVATGVGAGLPGIPRRRAQGTPTGLSRYGL